MLFKVIFLGFLYAASSHSVAAQSVGQSGDQIQGALATRDDVDRLRALIKKEFSFQSNALKNGEISLSEINLQTKSLDAALVDMKAMQVMGLENLRYICEFLGLILAIQMLGLWLSKKCCLTKDKKSPNEDGGVINLDSKNEGVKSTLQTAPAPNMPPTSLDNVGELSADIEGMTAHLLAASRVRLNNAAEFHGHILPQNSELKINIDDPSNSISRILANAKSIRINGLEKINSPQMQKHPPPLRLAMRPTTILGNNRPFKSQFIRSKILFSGKVPYKNS